MASADCGRHPELSSFFSYSIRLLQWPHCIIGSNPILANWLEADKESNMIRNELLHITFSVVLIVLFLTFLVGCSMGLGTSPIIDFPDDLSFVSDRGDAESTLVGAYNIFIDRSNLQSEILPARNLSSYDTIEVIDITNFLTLAPCTDCVKIRDISLDSQNNIHLNIGIRHPFPAGDPTLPISGKNRADLLIYDVEGVLISDVTNTINFPFTGATVGEPYLLNADGYTGYLDSSLDAIYPTATNVHPYVLHFADYSDGNYDPIANPQTGYPFPNPQTSPPTIPYGHLVMAQGSDYDFREYVLNPCDGSQIEFLYAVLGTYGVCATRNERFSPQCRVPQHQKKAAIELDIYSTGDSNLISGESDSSVDLAIEVVDTNHGCPVGDGLTQIQFRSDVQSIILEIPDILNAPAMLNNPVPISGDGLNPDNPLLYAITISNEKSSLEGIYYGLLKVMDSYPVGENNPLLLNSKDAIKRVPPGSNPLEGLTDLSEFATYLVFQIEVYPEIICPDNYIKERDKVISDSVDIYKTIDERCISVSGDNVYIVYKKTITLGGCSWPPAYDWREIRCLYSHNGGATFSESIVKNNYCEAPFMDIESLCVTSDQSTVIVFWTLIPLASAAVSYDGGATFPNTRSFDYGQDVIKRPAIAMNSLGDVFIAWINEFRPTIMIDCDYTIQCIIGDTDLNFSSPDVVTDDDHLIFQGFSVKGGLDCDIACNSTGNFFVVWTDADEAMEPESGWIVYDRFDGTSFGIDKKVSGNETGLNGRFPSVALGANDDVYVAWHIAGSPGSIYISHGTVAGDFAGLEIAAEINDPSFEVRPCLACDSTGAPHVLFCNRDPVSGNQDVYTSWECTDDLPYSTFRINEPFYPSGIKRPIASMAILGNGELAAVWTSNESTLVDEGSLRFGFLSAQ